MKRNFIARLARDLEAPIEARGFGTGWFSGFFALVLATAGLSGGLALVPAIGPMLLFYLGGLALALVILLLS